MEISRTLIELIMLFEGYSSAPYLDSAGLRTIGYGHLAEYGRNNGNIYKLFYVADHVLETISEDNAERLLIMDIKGVYRRVYHILQELNLSQNKLDAIVSLVYNIGIEAFESSTLLKRLMLKDAGYVSEEFLRWNKITVEGQKIELEGLTRRRILEKTLFDGVNYE